MIIAQSFVIIRWHLHFNPPRPSNTDFDMKNMWKNHVMEHSGKVPVYNIKNPEIVFYVKQ